MLNDAERRMIAEAVRQAERRTRAEIYCVLAERSSDYREVPLAWAAGAALLGPALLLLFGIEVSAPELFGGWTAAQVGAVAETAARSALIGAIVLQGVLFVATAAIVALPPVRRALTPAGLKRKRVRAHAQELFLAKNLHLTRERTGVLLFVSQAEHMVELVADDGVDAEAGPGVWDEAVAALVAELKRRRPAEGFVAAVGRIAEVLAPLFPADPSDNPNELPDAVVEIPRL